MHKLRDVVIALVLATGLLAGAAASAQSPRPAARTPGLSDLAFLIGDWVGEGSGEPGRAAGTFTFSWEAERHAILRRNEANVDAGQHQDVLLVFADGDRVRGTYVDNEGHVIEYVATIDTARKRVVFESAGPGPRFRLWYELQKDNGLTSGFEMAAPGSTEFKSYLEGKARRK